jgi:stress-induced-phosphoprotein 1
MLQAAALKDQANKAFAAKQYDLAVDLYSQAITLEPKNHVFYSNRSAARAGKKQWADALADAEEVRRGAFICISPMGKKSGA